MPPPLIAINCDAFTDPAIPITGVRAPYCHAVLSAGGTPILIPFLENMGQIDQILDRVDGVLLTGGDDLPAHRLGAALHPKAKPVIPARDQSDFLLIERLIARQVPTLAICLGFQQLNVHLGGTVYQDLTDECLQAIAHGHPGAGFAGHPIQVRSGSLLASIWGGVSQAMVNSGHHQAIRDLATGLDPNATSPDGLVEAAHLHGHPFFLGVQWHPERMQDDPNQRRLFSELVGRALDYAQLRELPPG